MDHPSRQSAQFFAERFVMSFFAFRPVARMLPLLILPASFIVGCNGYRGTPEKEALTKNRLNQLSFAVAQYSDDYDDMLPPAGDAANLKRVLDTYIAHPRDGANISAQAEALFTAPISERQFVFNSSLAGTKLLVRTLPGGARELADNKILFYEPTADWKGKERYIVMQDGMVRRVSEGTWRVIKKESGIP
jgi:uncharacterized protein (DUF58 family)